MRGHLPPPVRGSAPSQKEKMTKISHFFVFVFVLGFLIFVPSDTHFSPLDAPTHQKISGAATAGTVSGEMTGTLTAK